jgi:predicted transcriptional regulator
MPDRKMFATRLSPDLLKRLKHLSVDEEVSISELTEEAILDLLKKYEKKPKK